MGSQSDLDQGGTFRQYERVWLGPSLGWQTIPQQAMLPITAVGAVAISRGINLITVNVNANGVILNLPSAKAGLPGPLPGQWYLYPITIVDIGGFAAAHPIVINPSGAGTI